MKYVHEARPNNVSNIKRIKREKLVLPPASSEKWKELDKLIEIRLKQSLSKKAVRGLDSSSHSLRLLDNIYEVLSGEVEVHKSVFSVSHNHPKRKNKKLEELRKKKNELRKAWKVLCKQALENTEGALLIADKWKKTMRRFEESSC